MTSESGLVDLLPRRYDSADIDRQSGRAREHGPVCRPDAESGLAAAATTPDPGRVPYRSTPAAYILVADHGHDRDARHEQPDRQQDLPSLDGRDHTRASMTTRLTAAGRCERDHALPRHRAP